MALCGSLWLDVVLCGSMWLCVVPCGSMWLYVVPYGSLWLLVVPCGSMCLHVALCGFQWFHVRMWLYMGLQFSSLRCCLSELVHVPKVLVLSYIMVQAVTRHVMFAVV